MFFLVELYLHYFEFSRYFFITPSIIYLTWSQLCFTLLYLFVCGHPPIHKGRILHSLHSESLKMLLLTYFAFFVLNVSAIPLFIFPTEALISPTSFQHLYKYPSGSTTNALSISAEQKFSLILG